MPLHDWRDARMWSNLHLLWMGEILRWLKPRLPPGYRAHLGSLPVLAVVPPAGRPDVHASRTDPAAGPVPAGFDPFPVEPDFEAPVATLTPPEVALYVTRGQALVAAIELISPRNKDRPSARKLYAGKYLGYLRGMVHLMVIDVLPRPAGFSFPDRIAERLQIPDQPPTPAPVAVSYRVDGELRKEPARLSIWRRPLVVGRPLPSLPLGLSLDESVMIDLEATYMAAAEVAYLT